MLSGPIGEASVTGTTLGVPYTEHDDENTNVETPALTTESMSRAEPSTLLRQYFEGLRIDSPTFLCAAKCTTAVTEWSWHNDVISLSSAMSPTTNVASSTASAWPVSSESSTTTEWPSWHS